MSSRNIKILLVSDLHAVMKGSDFESDSFLVFDSGGGSDFFNGFKEFLKDEDLVPDVVVCAGDISNKGSYAAFKNIWGGLLSLKEDMGCEALLCVPGNHDLQSRLDEEFDPKYFLQFHSPLFPSPKFEKNTHFGAWHWFHEDHNDFNAIMINTSAYHGYTDEYQRGRIAPNITDQIEKFIKSDEFNEKVVNFIVCHHHPRKMEHVEFGSDYEAIDGGEKFLDMISSVGKGAWIIFHGHKHWPQLQNVGPSSGPIMISSGSLSANIHDEIKKEVTNTFCYINIDIERTEETGVPSGSYLAYEHYLGRGWIKSRNKRMPHCGGFGSLSAPRLLAGKIKKHVEEQGNFVRISEMPDVESELRFMLPVEVEKLKSELERLGVETIEDEDSGFLDQFGVRA